MAVGVSAVTVAERYAGRPLLRLLDEYVIRVIGLIPTTSSTTLWTVVKTAFPDRAGATWEEILEGELGLPPAFKRKVQLRWGEYQRYMRDAGQTADPMAFVTAFVDRNFLPTIEPA